MNRLTQELDRIADSTNFNGIYTLNGQSASSMAVLQGGLLTELEDWQEPGLSTNNRGTAHVDAYTVAGTTGTPASVSIDFAGQTGADLIGKFMLVGHAGQYGKYQLVENADDATAGYRAIVINSSDNASQLAQTIYDNLGSISEFSPSCNGAVITLQETQNQGAKSIPVTFTEKEPDEYDEYMRMFSASVGHGNQFLIFSI